MGWVYSEGVGWLEDTKMVFDHDDGTCYRRIPPDEFPVYDAVDSTTIVMDGEPVEQHEHPGWMGVSDGEAPRAN